MLSDLLSSFCAGTATSLALAHPVEWSIHKYILHAKPKDRKRSRFLDRAARAHNDNHHGAYKGPAHYYRDITNENETIHFAKSDIGIIAGIASIIGATIDRSYALVSANPNFTGNNAAFISGVVAGSLVSYSCYEFTHHYMHVIGQRRLAINRVMGDTIQGGEDKRDGNLRLSKPLLDEICNTVEANIDRNAFKEPRQFLHYPKEVVSRLKGQIQHNIEREATRDLGRAIVAVHPEQSSEVLSATTEQLLKREEEYRKTMGIKESIRNWLSRRVQGSLRSSPIFRYLDNHHFIHHYMYGKNLNVAFPLMDKIVGTKEDSSPALLEEERKYWLCPNSPDIVKFKRKLKPEEVPAYVVGS